MLRCPAHCLQVPHRSPESVQRVVGRESVAVPDEVRQSARVPSVLPPAAAAEAQALGAAKSPVEVAGRGLESYRRQLRCTEPQVTAASLQLTEDRFLNFVVHDAKCAAGERL